jgi:hypothetical protein
VTIDSLEGLLFGYGGDPLTRWRDDLHARVAVLAPPSTSTNATSTSPA